MTEFKPDPIERLVYLGRLFWSMINDSGRHSYLDFRSKARRGSDLSAFNQHNQTHDVVINNFMLELIV